MTPIQRYLEVAREAASAAAEPIMRYYQRSFDIQMKPDKTPVTVADREAEQRIRAVLAAAFPDHGIYGEEYGADDKQAEFLWLIDPIDGTKSFVGGYGMFSTQVALMHDGEIVVGVSNAPAMEETAWAARGAGAWLNGERLRVSDRDTAKDASISTGNIGSLAASCRWGALGKVLAEAGRTRGYGDFYQYHRLAAGQLDAVIESDVCILDVAALSVIVTEAGGRMTDLDGAPFSLATRSALAANPRLHADLLKRLSTDVP